MCDAVFEKIENTVKKYNLIEKGDAVLVALSGGADSVFLLNSLLALREKYGIKIFAAHVNHSLRGKDADSDENFCRKICDEKNVPLFVKKEDVKKIAAERAVSEEVAGRQVRYSFFYELKKQNNIKKIATAHNSDDNVETVLMRFLRGTGVSGLCGIPYKNGDVIRPILDVSRSEIEAYLKENNISFVCDKTNFEEIYTRNKLRLRLIPEIEKEINKGFKKALLSDVSVYRECSDYLKASTDAAYEKCVAERLFYTEIDEALIKKEHIFMIKSVIQRVISGLDSEAVSEAVNTSYDVLCGKTSSANISGGITVMSAYGKLFFYKKLPENFMYSVSLPKTVILETGDEICFVKADIIDKKAGKNVIFVDSDKLGKLVIRSKKDGDFFYPSGKEKSKVKLKDYFINNKIPSFTRHLIPILTSDEQIVWVAGNRADRRFLADENTENILRIEYIKRGGF